MITRSYIIIHMYVLHHESMRPIFLVGHSFGARAAVHLLASELRRQLPSSVRGIVAQLGNHSATVVVLGTKQLRFGYPLVHPTQHREKKLLDLPAGTRVSWCFRMSSTSNIVRLNPCVKSQLRFCSSLELAIPSWGTSACWREL